VVVNRVPVFTPRPAFSFVTSRLRVRFCGFAPARSHNRRTVTVHSSEFAVPHFTAPATHLPLCALCVPLWLRSSPPICVNLRTPVRPSRKNRNRVSRVNGVIDHRPLLARSSRQRSTLRAAAATTIRSARPSRRGAPLAAATNRYGATEKKGTRMTAGCPVRHSFSDGGVPSRLRVRPPPSSQPSLSAIASAAADAFCLLPCPSPLPSWTSWLRVRPPHPARIIPKDPERGGDISLEFKKTAPITPNLFMRNQLTTKLTLNSAAFSRVFPGFLRASQRLLCFPTRVQPRTLPLTHEKVTSRDPSSILSALFRG
jgi:hypothetical protein